MSDDQTASAGSEPACRPGSTPGRGTGETPADVATVEVGQADADESGRRGAEAGADTRRLSC